MDELYAEDFSHTAIKSSRVNPSLSKSDAAAFKEALPTLEFTPAYYFKKFKEAIELQSKNPNRLLPLVADIELCLEAEDYKKILLLLNDLEEIMDLELPRDC